jgi:SAM-dependent methyltransferase
MSGTPTCFNSTWDDDPAGYDRKRDVWLNRRRDERVIEFLRDVPPGGRVLELGCGTGTSLLRVARACPQLGFTGVDPLRAYIAFAEAAARASEAPNVRFVTGRGEELGTLFPPDAAFDRVYSTDVIHHLADEQKALDGVAAVVRPGAVWLAFEPSWLNPYIFAFQSLTAGERNFRPNRFLALADKRGWELVGKRYITLIPSLIPEPPNWLKRIEAALESLPILAGRIALVLRRK